MKREELLVRSDIPALRSRDRKKTNQDFWWSHRITSSMKTTTGNLICFFFIRTIILTTIAVYTTTYNFHLFWKRISWHYRQMNCSVVTTFIEVKCLFHNIESILHQRMHWTCYKPIFADRNEDNCNQFCHQTLFESVVWKTERRSLENVKVVCVL